MSDKPLTDEELEIIKDKFRGGPRRKLMEFADSIGVDYDEMMQRAEDYIKNEEYWCEGDRFDGVYTPPEFWDWYELVTYTVVPSDKRGGFFSCSC